MKACRECWRVLLDNVAICPSCSGKKFIGIIFPNEQTIPTEAIMSDQRGNRPLTADETAKMTGTD